MELTSPLLAAIVSAVLSLSAVMARALTPVAGIGAFLIGTAVIVGTGAGGALALGSFFVGSTLVSRLGEPRQPRWIDAKGSRRDQWQVLANGGVAAAGGLVGWWFDQTLGLWVATAALAAAAADTWATSLGAFSRRDPWHPLRRVRVPKGTSGGVSLIGSAGGAVGSAVVAAAPLVAGAPPVLAGSAFLIGMLGMVADSLLGATVQGRFECPACNLASEHRRHRCGAPTRHAGGMAWLNNDAVNLLATILAGCAGWGWWAACCSP
ncbi:MAG TPA: DUF92 domain-containing protein [Gemmatimonadales bacterium]|nr:DUF92 domain-containing protein [Gemmatimonadales bacterium]